MVNDNAWTDDEMKEKCREALNHSHPENILSDDLFATDGLGRNPLVERITGEMDSDSDNGGGDGEGEGSDGM